MSKSVLLTAAKEDAEMFRERLAADISLAHYPLERYQEVEEQHSIRKVLNRLDQFENIIYGSKRNAQFFIEQLKEYDKLNVAREQLNMATDQRTADYLEAEGITAVHPHSNGKAVDMLEFMLRARRLGETLYPCGDKTKEGLPGLLQELEMPVEELVLFTLQGPEEEELKKYWHDIEDKNIDVAIFHSRRSINRTLAAFPDLEYKKVVIISADQAVSNKLEDKGVKVDTQAGGSWDSILEILNNFL